MLDPTPLLPGQTLATTADIRDCPDLAHMPVTPGITRADGGFEPFWRKSDGTPLTVDVRAPSLSERRAINQAAGDNDDDFILETCARCVILDPPLGVEPAKEIFRTKNPLVLEQLSATAWQLATLPAGLVAAETRRILDRAARPARPARTRKLARKLAAAPEPALPAPDHGTGAAAQPE